MSRITGSEALGLMEAYHAVYAPRLSEEEIQEGFETWVNSLVEEGYDLSEYTWEEMYEEYISEAPKVDPKFIAKGSAGGQTAFKAGGGAAAVAKGKSVADVQKAGMSAYRGAGGNAALAAGGGQSAVRSGKSATDVQMQGLRNLYKAGGGNAQAQKTGQTPAQVAAQGSKNISTAAYKAGGGNAQAVKTGQSTAQIQAQGAKNLGAAFKAGGGFAAMKKYGQTAQQVAQKGTDYNKAAAAKAATTPKPPLQNAGNSGAGSGKPPVATTKPPAAPVATKTAPTPAAKPQLGPTGKPLVGGIERRTPTSQEMQDAAAKKSAASTPNFTQKAANVNLGSSQFKNSSQATTAASSTTDKGVAPLNDNLAAKSKPVTPDFSTKEGDNKLRK
jgi:hypothetical protein